jgi:hypothetical protein
MAFETFFATVLSGTGLLAVFDKALRTKSSVWQGVLLGEGNCELANGLKLLPYLARPTGFEPVISAFGGERPPLIGLPQFSSRCFRLKSLEIQLRREPP